MWVARFFLWLHPSRGLNGEHFGTARMGHHLGSTFLYPEVYPRHGQHHNDGSQDSDEDAIGHHHVQGIELVAASIAGILAARQEHAT